MNNVDEKNIIVNNVSVRHKPWWCVLKRTVQRAPPSKGSGP